MGEDVRPIVIDSIRYVSFSIVAANMFGVPGLGSYLSTNGILGYAFQLSNRVYFLNFFGCPTITYVSNSRDYVYGYDFLYGNQLYQGDALADFLYLFSFLPSINIDELCNIDVHSICSIEFAGFVLMQLMFVK